MTLIEILVVLAILAAVGAMLARGIGSQRTAALKKQEQLEATRIVDLIRVKMIEDDNLSLDQAHTALQADLKNFKVKHEVSGGKLNITGTGTEGSITEDEIKTGNTDIKLELKPKGGN